MPDGRLFWTRARAVYIAIVHILFSKTESPSHTELQGMLEHVVLARQLLLIKVL